MLLNMRYFIVQIILKQEPVYKCTNISVREVTKLYCLGWVLGAALK